MVCDFKNCGTKSFYMHGLKSEIKNATLIRSYGKASRPMRKNNGQRQRDENGFRLRAAGVCIRQFGRERQILLVSSGKGDDLWVIPGGGIEKNEDERTAALREVYEEAGIRAQIVSRVGEFRDEERKHRTVVFLLEVVEELSEWEDGYFGRKRQWMSFEESMRKVKRSQSPIIQRVQSI
ncbi:hypothetical protein AB6A40_003468 [Gnathostoma spinigerum]|uniref:diphosphoinositol-polyphosphate diphosphatase n=1 Tax=Gnathostoma spinigerum TaxID=75299 RepID=A0ABD6EHE3_9BILA